MMQLRPYRNEDLFSAICLAAGLIGLALTLGGCERIVSTREPTLADRSFVTGRPCAPPCWYGLEVDKSTEKDVDDKLRELPFVDQAAIEKSSVVIFDYSDVTQVDYGCVDPKGKYCGYIFLAEGVIKQINLDIYYELSLQTVVNQLGTPTAVSCTQSPHGKHPSILYVDWLDRDISVKIDGNPALCDDLNRGAALAPDLQVIVISYSSKDIIAPWGCYLRDCLAWPGFKK